MPHGRPSGLMHSTSHVCHIHVLESKTTWRSASTGKQTWIKLICSQISPEFAPFINRCCWISTTINHSKSLFNLSPPPKKNLVVTEGRGFRPTARRGNVTKRFDIDTILLYIFLEKQTLKFKVDVLADKCTIDLHPLCPTMSDPNCKHSWLLNKIQRHISRKELNQTVCFQVHNHYSKYPN